MGRVLGISSNATGRLFHSQPRRISGVLDLNPVPGPNMQSTDDGVAPNSCTRRSRLRNGLEKKEGKASAAIESCSPSVRRSHRSPSRHDRDRRTNQAREQQRSPCARIPAAIGSLSESWPGKLLGNGVAAMDPRSASDPLHPRAIRSADLP